MAALEGPLSGKAQYAFVKRIPLSARRSMFGVCRSVFPAQLMAWAQCWSVIMYMMFGLSWAAAIAGKAARPIINDLFISNQFSVPPR